MHLPIAGSFFPRILLKICPIVKRVCKTVLFQVWTHDLAHLKHSLKEWCAATGRRGATKRENVGAPFGSRGAFSFPLPFIWVARLSLQIFYCVLFQPEQRGRVEKLRMTQRGCSFQMMGNIETGFLTESSYLSPRRKAENNEKKKQLFWDQVRLFNRRRIALKVFKGEVVEPKNIHTQYAVQH